MKTFKIIAFIFFGIILYSCRGDNEIRTNAIIVGEYSKMTINHYDTTLLGGYNTPKHYNLDLDNDGIDDIQFECELWGSPAIGQNPKSVIKSLNDNVQIFGFHNNDTLFLNRDTSYHYISEDNIDMICQFNYTCHRINLSDSIISITPTFKLNALDKGDILNVNDIYNSDTITMINDDYRIELPSPDTEGDTTIYKYATYFNDCNDFPLEEIVYIGVRFKNDLRLGWIKVNLLEKAKLLILESGIQE